MKFSCLILLVCLLLQGCTEQKSTGETEGQKSHALLGFDRVTGERKYQTDVGDLAFLFDGPGIVQDSKLYFVATEPDNAVLLVADVKTGAMEKASFPPTATSTDTRALPFLMRRGLVGKFDPAGGQVPQAPSVSGLPLAVQDNNLYSATPDVLICYDTKNWDERWKVKLAGTSHVAVGENGEVAAVNPNGCRFYSADGKELWRVDTPFQPSGVALSDNAVLVGTAKPKLWSLDRKSGEKLWDQSWDSGANGWARPRVAGDLVAFPVGSNLEAFDIATGEKKWTFESVGSAVGVDPSADQFFVVSHDRDSLSCVDATNGQAVWTKKSETKLVGPASFDDEGVYLFGVVDVAPKN
jgi:outer membrane protein assembly factor BamB